jgi:myo-inositol-1(or 4)-monophosphatase
MIDYKELCLATCQIARDSGRFMAKERLSFDSSMIEHKGLHDLVSYVDRASEERIIAALQALLPESGFIAEEGTSTKRGERFNWVIDPLDGTTNFIQGIPIYSVSIALMDGEELVIGVVYEVGQDECFYAWKDGGAFLNDKPIQVSSTVDTHHALMATGFPYTNFKNLDKYMQYLSWAMTSTRGLRRLGSAAVDLSYVACGRFDAFFECDLKAWDVAAGAFIVQEAGGNVFDFDGGKNFIFGGQIIASNVPLTVVMLEKAKELMQ